jgi:hypothetical protein
MARIVLVYLMVVSGLAWGAPSAPSNALIVATDRLSKDSTPIAGR